MTPTATPLSLQFLLNSLRLWGQSFFDDLAQLCLPGEGVGHARLRLGQTARRSTGQVEARQHPTHRLRNTATIKLVPQPVRDR